jgi:hypothetical protein
MVRDGSPALTVARLWDEWHDKSSGEMLKSRETIDKIMAAKSMSLEHRAQPPRPGLFGHDGEAGGGEIVHRDCAPRSVRGQSCPARLPSLSDVVGRLLSDAKYNRGRKHRARGRTGGRSTLRDPTSICLIAPLEI